MVFNIVLILIIIFISIQFEKLVKIPSPISLIVLSIVTSNLFPDFLSFTTSEFFAEEMLVFIVLLVLGDAFILKLKDLKENWVSLFILSVISVVLAIMGGVLFKDIILPYSTSVDIEQTQKS